MNVWEVEFYSDIIDQAIAIADDYDEKFIWKCQKIIELMKYLKCSHNKRFVKDALILVLALCEDDHIDSTKSKSAESDSFSKHEKKNLIFF